ncbi:hypothetical protein LFR94_004670 [Vibrio vulnificus]|uniref:hypothetical protein n=1 Tax=Vibrio vulnificus TaxID=672 RepID=UPI001D4502BC|nr:hypothetical protein [Vibrio vulnificus]EGQ7988667.1 hypothetical protein [Vibrio vulnificus]EGQ9240304.1 hypothetical protein [Vibrio vulnificus]EGR7964474.1 hypothetical protein [Vibrio vulnificus]EGR7987348.1 hypothetical protein [Vibrio vulnificus]
MNKPTKAIWIEILQAIPDEKEMGISDFNVLFGAYDQGYENGQCGFDAQVEQVFRNPHEAIRIAYSVGFKHGRES